MSLTRQLTRNSVRPLFAPYEEYRKCESRYFSNELPSSSSEPSLSPLLLASPILDSKVCRCCYRVLFCWLLQIRSVCLEHTDFFSIVISSAFTRSQTHNPDGAETSIDFLQESHAIILCSETKLEFPTNSTMAIHTADFTAPTALLDHWPGTALHSLHWVVDISIRPQ